MGWTAYQIRFLVLSQLHVGFRKIGNIQMTRRYLPSRSLWGALTARLTRGAQYGEWPLPGDTPSGDYVATGDMVRREIAFSYFFPEDDKHRPLPPLHEIAGLQFGYNRMSPEIFAWRYLASYNSTALDYGRSAAEEGTLHEVEFIVPHTREDNLSEGEVLRSHPVFLNGYILVSEDSLLPWEEALREIQIGGERCYGWGRLRLAEKNTVPVTNGEIILFEHLACRIDGERPVARVSGGSFLMSHTKVKGFRAYGDVEPLVSRSWDPHRGAGQQVEMTGGVCYAPGSRVEGEREHLFGWSMDNTWQYVSYEGG